jgi:glutamyl-tRNA(Gln) amidotransferase subunit E
MVVSNGRDYEKLGLKAGIEIHQQLDTKKLFCKCPSHINEESPDNTIKRILRASAGETGEVDVAAKYEIQKQKHYLYQYYDDTTCLVELDEEPPHEMNDNALKIVLQLSKMMDASVVDQVHVMRKTVLNGSNTSGFQRTALIARNGFIEVETDGKINKVRIDSLCLEEDAARIIEQNSEFDIYRLDRLGIPLIEIATGPDMKTPQQVKDTAAFIGMMLRSTGKVKRGLGTIRQDVNVSIAGGTRVEIKGVQDLRMVDTVVDLEATRQQKMLRLREEMAERKISAKNLSDTPTNYTLLFENSRIGFIKKALASGHVAYGKRFKDFKGFFGFDINPGRRFGSEISDRIKFLGLNGLIHSDENLEKYGLIGKLDIAGLDSDAMIIIIGPEETVLKAFVVIDTYISEFLEKGLSKEVRNAKDDGTSVFLRPMPGSSRMYPETDIPTIIPGKIKVEMPELITDKVARFEKEYSLPAQVAKELVFEPNFEILVKKYPQVKTMLIAESLASYPKEIKTLHNLDVDVDRYIDKILSKVDSGDLDASSVKEVLIAVAKGTELSRALDNFKMADESELAEFITSTISKHPQLNTNAVMGFVMKQYRGKYPGSRILELIKKFKGE